MATVEETGLLGACRNSQQSAISEWLAKGADPDVREADGHRPISLAMQGNNQDSALKILSALEKKYASSPQKLLDALTVGLPENIDLSKLATQKRWNEVSKEITRAITDAKINLGDKEQWFSAARSGDAAVLKKIIDAKLVDINLVDQDGYTALHRATSSGKINTINLLLEGGAEPDCRTPDNQSPLFLATDIIDESCGIAILDKLKKKYKHEPAKLLEAVTVAGGGNQSILIIASNRQQNVFSAGLRPVIEDTKVVLGDVEQWFTAAHSGNAELLDKILRANRININVVDKYGETALHICASHGHLAATQLLINNEADPDFRTPKNLSPLLVSMSSWRQDCGSFILATLKEKYATDPVRLLNAITAKRREGKTPEQSAEYHEYKELAEELHKLTELLQKTIAAMPFALRVAKPLPRPAPPRLVPRSNTPSPIRLDRTVTAVKLQEINGGGKSNLLTLCEQGQLRDVLTDKIWIGRREEMDEVWELVPQKYRNQVNIEVVRAQLSQATVRDRFKIGVNDWENGFKWQP